MKTRGKTYLPFLILVGLSSFAFSQETRPYLTGATIYISVDDWADIWLNGIPIVDSQRRTPEEKGFQKIQCVPEHICYFRQENVLAIVNTNAYVKPQFAGDQVGLAYSLHLRFSNGAQTVLSSNDLDENRAFFVPEREDREPSGWHLLNFDDSNWTSALSQGFHIPGLANLTDPETGIPSVFLSSRPVQPPRPGERHLYRRRFPLDIGPSPYCPETKKGFWGSASKIVSPKPKERAWVTPTPVPGFVMSAQTRPTATPVAPKAKAEPVSDPYKPLREFLALPTFTPEVAGGPAPEVAPAGQTIVFDRPPANIYVTFEDGPGVYQLEVYDLGQRSIRHLFGKKVIAEHGEWVDWDGKNEARIEVPAGDYWVFFEKDGKNIDRILIHKILGP
jgi:hypothetical protein